MAGYWPSSFFACLWTETKSRSIKSQKRTRPISSHLDRTSLVNKGFIIWDKTPKKWALYLRDKARNPERARSLHLARSGSQSQHGIWFILPTHGATHIIILTYLPPTWSSWSRPTCCHTRKVWSSKRLIGLNTPPSSASPSYSKAWHRLLRLRGLPRRLPAGCSTLWSSLCSSVIFNVVIFWCTVETLLIIGGSWASVDALVVTGAGAFKGRINSMEWMFYFLKKNVVLCI